MILEHAQLLVRPGEEEDFEESLARALPIINSAPECQGATVRRQVEDPSVYLLLVQWASLEAHERFRASELYQSWRRLTHPFYVTPIHVTHFRDLAQRG